MLSCIDTICLLWIKHFLHHWNGHCVAQVWRKPPWYKAMACSATYDICLPAVPLPSSCFNYALNLLVVHPPWEPNSCTIKGSSSVNTRHCYGVSKSTISIVGAGVVWLFAIKERRLIVQPSTEAAWDWCCTKVQGELAHGTYSPATWKRSLYWPTASFTTH